MMRSDSIRCCDRRIFIWFDHMSFNFWLAKSNFLIILIRSFYDMHFHIQLFSASHLHTRRSQSCATQTSLPVEAWEGEEERKGGEKGPEREGGREEEAGENRVGRGFEGLTWVIHWIWLITWICALAKLWDPGRTAEGIITRLSLPLCPLNSCFNMYGGQNGTQSIVSR